MELGVKKDTKGQSFANFLCCSVLPVGLYTFQAWLHFIANGANESYYLLCLSLDLIGKYFNLKN